MLTDSILRSLKPAASKQKPIRITDGDGLLIEVNHKGKKTWRVRYDLKVGDKVVKRMITAGQYPQMGLRDARIAAEPIRAMVREGRDPVLSRKQEKLANATALASTFRAVIDDFLTHREDKIGAATLRDRRGAMEKFFYPKLGHLPARDVTPRLLRDVARECYAVSPTQCRKSIGVIRRAFADAIFAEIIESNAADGLREQFEVPVSTPRKAILNGDPLVTMMSTIYALKDEKARDFFRLLAMTFVRPVVLCQATWTEIDFKTGIWSIPGSRMKMRRPLIVPLAPQAMEILRRRKLAAGNSPWVFSLLTDSMKPLNRQDALGFLRDLGDVSAEHDLHGFRALADTSLEDAGFDSAAIDMSMAHTLSNRTKALYDRGEKLHIRAPMLAAYATFIDDLGAGKSRDEAMLTMRQARRELALAA